MDLADLRAEIVARKTALETQRDAYVKVAQAEIDKFNIAISENSGMLDRLDGKPAQADVIDGATDDDASASAA
jgi:hypothetical protein